MRPAALEIIGIAGPKDAALALDRHLEPAAENDAALLAIVDQRGTAGVAARFVAFFQDLQRAPEQVLADLPIGDQPLADLGQFVGPVENLARPVGLEREE